jgi:hypothetical protein
MPQCNGMRTAKQAACKRQGNALTLLCERMGAGGICAATADQVRSIYRQDSETRGDKTFRTLSAPLITALSAPLSSTAIHTLPATRCALPLSLPLT